MPVYEYKCKSCNKEFELLIFSGETAKCPYCGSENLEKKISLPNFSVKGSNGSISSISGGDSCNSCSIKNCSSCG